MAMSNFEKVAHSLANGILPITKYRSKKTGLTVCIASVEGPLVNGYFCLATEAHDDDGLPHTLEHLVFMGSEDYPYKGVLDLLANRCLAQGTNAWTDIDHTCYTITTAGSQGFLSLLPIYLDHILYPTLKDSAYLTEVHHVNGDGEDAGVVYCEMQGRENSGESRTHLAMLRAMYPGHCGYKSETGGIMANLRESTTNAKVRSYHKDYYRPDNFCLIITGQVEPEEVFGALEKFEDKIESKGKLEEMMRPWQSPVPPLGSPMDQTVLYSADEEDNGMFLISWRGPKSKDLYTQAGLLILLEYLTDTPVAPLQRDLVEIEDPFCNNVFYSIIENAESCFYLKCNNVPMEKLKDVKEKLLSVLKNIAIGGEPIDKERLDSLIHKQILENLNNTEDKPHDTFAFMLIGDFLFGDNTEDFEGRINPIKDLKQLQSEDIDFWLNLLRKYMVDSLSVSIIGEPSKKLMDDMAKDEKARIAKQREELGEKGLKLKGEQLEKATEENEIEAPKEIVSSLDIPGTGSIHFHPIERNNNLSNDKALLAQSIDLKDIPFTFELDNIHSNFVQLFVLLDTSNVPSNLRPYICLFIEVILESPVIRDGTLVSHEKIVKELAADTLTAETSQGIFGSRFSCGAYDQLICLSLKVEMKKYARGVGWLQELLFGAQFTVDRLKIIAAKMVNDVARMKRSGRTVVRALLYNIIYKPESNHYQSILMRQYRFLSALVEKLNTNPDKVIQDLEALQKILTMTSNFRVHMSTDVKKLGGQLPLLSPWKKVFSDHSTNSGKHLDLATRTHQQLATHSTGQAVMVGIGSIESSFLIQCIPGVTSSQHPDLPALMVFSEYLTTIEGPLWRQIRGLGLAYGYSLYASPSQGLIYFILSKSTHLVNAYKKGKEIVDGFVNGTVDFEEVQLESAISSTMFEVIDREQTVSESSLQSMLNYLRKVEQNYNRELLDKLSKVTIEDLKRVGSQYIAHLFDVNHSWCAVVCNPSKVEEIKDGFKELSREFSVITSLEDGFEL